MLNKILKDYLRRLKIRITLPWLGEKGLKKPKLRDSPITKEEIWKDLKNKEG